MSNSQTTIPVLLLKTQSQPHDAYEEYFTSRPMTAGTGSLSSSPVFLPEFVPVLEHRPNTVNLDSLEASLKSGQLKQQYGGMIFTSQRAVEAWADVVKRTEQETESQLHQHQQQEETQKNRQSGSGMGVSSLTANDVSESKNQMVDDDLPFPLYSVGPATSRALNTLVAESSAVDSAGSSPFSRLHPAIFGEHTGNGDNLARYILSHYNELHSHKLYTFYDAPRLPFTPVMGTVKGERIDKDDARLQKKPLLFLVGEQRRDIIPKTLMDPDGKLDPNQRIGVDEVEVYITAIAESFQLDFQTRLTSSTNAGYQVVVVVVFSPQGCEAMLRSLGYMDEDGTLTQHAKDRWSTSPQEPSKSRNSQRYVIATIGPTTRDHLKRKFGFDADVCAAKPSPEGVGGGVRQFLAAKGLI